jgi:chromosome segregation ATPase
MGATASTANKIKPLSAEDIANLLQQQISQLQQQIESGKKQNAELQQQLENSKKQNAELQQQLENSKQQNAELQQQLENSKQQNAELQQQLESDKQRNSQLQQLVENDQPGTAQFDRDITHAAQRKDEAFMREVFNNHATNEKISASALVAALKYVAAPVLAAASSEGSINVADYVFRRADANLSGDVDFAE